MDVLGNSPNTTLVGALKCAKLSRQNDIKSASDVFAPECSVTNAQGVSPHFSLDFATTAASITSGCLKRTDSTSIVLIFSPPEMMISFERSLSSI